MADGSTGRVKTNGATQSRKANQEKVAEMVRKKHDTNGGLTLAQREAVTRWEREHTSRKTERVVAFDGNGKVLYESKDGSHNRTGIPSWKNLEDAVITHNHPSRTVRSADSKLGWASGVGISFSGNDMSSAAHFNAKEMRAKANGYVYSLRRPQKGWPSSQTLLNEYKKAFAAAQRKYLGGTTKRAVTNYAWKGAKSTQEAYNRLDRINATMSHMATREVAKKHGITYTRSRA